MQGSILKISEAAAIAIHAMIFLAQKKTLMSLVEIATVLGVSSNHLSKVLQRLHKSGLIESIKGRNGGFKLSKPANKVSFLDIYEIFDGEFTQNKCLIAHENCSQKCIFGDLIISVNTMVKEKFKNTYLSEFEE